MMSDRTSAECANSRSRIVRDQEWDSTAAKLNALDLTELVLGLLGLDAVDGEAALGVVDETEVLASLVDGDDVHEAGGVGHVGADLAVDLDEALHEDGAGLAEVEGVLEAVAEEDNQRQAVAKLVRTGRGAGSVGSGQLVQEPVRRRAKALLVLLAVRALSEYLFVSRVDSIMISNIVVGILQFVAAGKSKSLERPTDFRIASTTILKLEMRIGYQVLTVPCPFCLTAD